MKKIAAFVVSLLLLSNGTAFPQTEIYLSITKSKATKVIVAVPDFQPQGPSDLLGDFPSWGAKVLRDDLDFSGIFNVQGNTEFVAEVEASDRREGSIDFPRWGSLGAQALVKVSFAKASDEVTLEGKVFDVSRGRMIIGKRYAGKVSSLRYMVHAFSDDIVYMFAGEMGVARTRIAFVSKHEGNKELYIMDFDGENVVRMTTDRSIITSPAWSVDGRSILFTSYIDNNPDLYLLDIFAGKRSPFSMRPGINLGAEWSPGGERVVMVLSKDGNPEIYVADPSGKKLERLTRNRNIDSSPTWSPNGREIAFTSDRDGSAHIYIMDADGGNIRRVTSGKGFHDSPAWSPKGDMIAYVSRVNGRFQIFTYKVDGSEVRQLTDKGDNEDPSWSPDGRHIAFSSSITGIPQIYTMNFDGSGKRRLTFLKGGGYTPSWSPRFVEGKSPFD